MSYSTIISPHHLTFLDGLSISFAPTPEAIDGEYGGTYVPDSPERIGQTQKSYPELYEGNFEPHAAAEAIPCSERRECRFCKTIGRKGTACWYCGAPEQGSQEPSTCKAPADFSPLKPMRL